MKKNTPKKDERRYGSFWVCPHCEAQPEFEHKAMMEHLKEAHQIDSKNCKGTKRVLMHLDGDTWFSWQYEWEINGLKFIQTTCDKRSPESAAMWMGDDE